MKQVIFVGGTPYSGSTFLHMILANDPKGFACGEVHSLFYPSRSRHLNPVCGCGDGDCDFWYQVREHGVDNLYESIFDLFPEVEFIVDSSKNLFWMRSQTERLRKKGIQARSLLIWKTPLEFAFSCKRRGRLKDWDSVWLNYHRLFFSLIGEWRAVQYRPVTSNTSVLEQVCQYVEIPYFPEKDRFWDKPQHVLFGSHSARLHLYSKDVAQEFVSDGLSEGKVRFHQTIYYEPVEDESLQRVVDEARARSANLDRTEGMLRTYDVAHEAVEPDQFDTLRVAPAYLAARRLRYFARTRIGSLRYTGLGWR
jgi:hypothetical protein